MRSGIPRMLVGIVALASIFLVGCGQGGAAMPSQSTACAPLPGGTEVPHMAPDLEARLPDEIGGAVLCAASVTSDVMVSPTSGDYADLVRTLDEFRRTPSDLATAWAAPRPPASGLVIGAIRLAGVDGIALLRPYLQMQERARPGTTFSLMDLGGKRVVALTDPASVDQDGIEYFYAAGDALYFVTSPDQGDAAQAIALLP